MSDYVDPHAATSDPVGSTEDAAFQGPSLDEPQDLFDSELLGHSREERDNILALSGWIHPKDLADGPDDAHPEWLGNAVCYDWDDTFGEVGPRNPELEVQLYQNPDCIRPDIGTPLLTLGMAKITRGEELAPFAKFEDAGLHPIMMENVKLCGYTVPTPIQSLAIPAVLHGMDVVGIAQTGSGKTAAYLMPIISRLMGKAKMMAAPRPSANDHMAPRVTAEPLVLIVCPTRELACQIFDECRRLCYRSMLRPCVIYGGAPIRDQKMALEKGCDILVATPGRFQDFLKDARLLSFRRLKYTVIDEADEMLGQGWEETIEALFTHPGMNNDDDHTYLMFSATFPKETRRMARDYMAKDHIRIEVGRIGSTTTNIKQEVVWVENHLKDRALFDMLNSKPAQRTMIFVNTKAACDRVDDYLFTHGGFPVTSIHSGRTQREREDAMRSFRTGRCPILVATGVSARGLDAHVEHVINYDLPSNMHGGITEYVHRIGRTARIGKSGQATSFFNDRNEDIAEALVKILLEAKQTVPDILEPYTPADTENIDFEDESDSDDGADGAAEAFGDLGIKDDSGDLDSGFNSGPEQTLDAGDFNAGGDDGFTPDDSADKLTAW